MRIPALTRSLARPATRGTSGPTTTKPTFCFWQKEMTAELSDTSRSGTQAASPELVIPGFPGAHNTEPQEGERFKAWQRACSLPPPPITRTTMLSSAQYNTILSQNLSVFKL